MIQSNAAEKLSGQDLRFRWRPLFDSIAAVISEPDIASGLCKRTSQIVPHIDDPGHRSVHLGCKRDGQDYVSGGCSAIKGLYQNNGDGAGVTQDENGRANDVEYSTFELCTHHVIDHSFAQILMSLAEFADQTKEP